MPGTRLFGYSSSRYFLEIVVSQKLLVDALVELAQTFFEDFFRKFPGPQQPVLIQDEHKRRLTEAATSRRAHRRPSVDLYGNRWIIFPTKVFTLPGGKHSP